jgi:GntR family transcriptional regulator
VAQDRAVENSRVSNLPLPKYHRVYLVLRQQLDEGRFADGVPGELTLMESFGVSRVTVRRALEQLASEGLITRHPGRATLPTRARAAEGAAATAPSSQTQLTGLLENLVSMGLRTSVNVMALETLAAPESVAQTLDVSTGDLVQKAVRVRSTREGPLSRITTWVPLSVARPFTRRELSRKPILLLLEEDGVKVGRRFGPASGCADRWPAAGRASRDLRRQGPPRAMAARPVPAGSLSIPDAALTCGRHRCQGLGQ